MIALGIKNTFLEAMRQFYVHANQRYFYIFEKHLNLFIFLAVSLKETNKNTRMDECMYTPPHPLKYRVKKNTTMCAPYKLIKSINPKGEEFIIYLEKILQKEDNTGHIKAA